MQFHFDMKRTRAARWWAVTMGPPFVTNAEWLDYKDGG